MSEKYKANNPDKIYFVTFAVVQWVDAFTRREYKDILVDSLQYCQKEKGLIIYAWCIMTNHLHLALGTDGKLPLADIMRDFKKFTSVSLVRAIQENSQESRKEWLLSLFQTAAAGSAKHQKYQFWQSQYHPVELTSNGQQQRCLEYIHQNPVVAGIVNTAEAFLYSSATDYAGGKGLIEITFME
ncbi:REP-associated tyrosine transposase [Rufibacter quisquiliarum]|uniref:REP element-mobilizing transposase RayT n=1 Tax=Rufibacter quisquiliarum TaxID=1549639 RepID=A0A839GH47_9BACT|nr:transposase [Rufibacter quisquiliarum]MBA9078984.1 REP element-mobilizing transposase RayT [Rufibacter quisquiliarum]